MTWLTSQMLFDLSSGAGQGVDIIGRGKRDRFVILGDQTQCV